MLSALRDWFLALPEEARVGVRYEESPDDRSKRSAWIVVEGPAASGQLTLWETGECELEAEATFDDQVLLQETSTVASESDVARAAESLLATVRSHQ